MKVAYVRCKCDECKTTEGILEGLEETAMSGNAVLMSERGCEVKFGISQ